MENFDRLLREGSRAVVEKTEGIDEMSPVGMAFEKARAAGFTLYSKDNKHQNRLGSYLKACVNYLFLYSEPFDESLDLSCGIDCATAKTLREIASAVVGD